MEKKFSIRGYKERADAPILYDEQAYSLEEARVKALEYFKKTEILSKIVIYDQEKGEEKGAQKFIFRNKKGDLREVDFDDKE